MCIAYVVINATTVATMQPNVSSDGAGSPTLRELINERNTLMDAIAKIAAFDDERANRRLERHQSYSWFDEPKAVQIAREALDKIGAAA
jgi:hypothetical protein